MSVVIRTHTGKIRENNEDSLLLVSPYLFAIADGMGGYNAGEIASNLALDKLKAGAEALRDKIGTGLEKALRQTMQEINRAVYEKARQDKDCEGMGTTLTGICFSGNGTGYVFNVGDSRLYLQRDGKLKQITRDHSVVEEMVERGEITPEEAFDHPRKNMLTRGIGIDAVVEGDVFAVDILYGDRFLLCSDGLSDMLRDAEMEEILRREDTEAAADALLQGALDRGGKDNISLILIKPERKDVKQDGR